MTDFLPKEVMDGLRAAQRLDRRRKSKLRVHIDDNVFPILEFSENGFAVDTEQTPHMRGHVDIYEGPRHLYRALIVASSEEGDLMRYEYKRNTAASNTAPVDFETADPLSMAYLPRG